MASIPRSPINPEARYGRAGDRLVVAACLVLAAGLAWAWLLYQAWAMEHMDLVEMAMPGLDAWRAGDLALVFTMWSVMMVGMMAPAVSPVVLLFTRIQQGRHAQGKSFVSAWVFLLGYLCVWTAFSLFATAAQWGLHSAALLTPGMDRVIPLAGGIILVAAGAYQWTPAKRACLARCRSPLGFLLGEWREGELGALLMGLRHGLFCTGCCWALMLILFVVGVMNLYWVAGLTLFVLLERAMPGGPWLARAAGVLLIAWGSWVAVAAQGL